MGCGFLVLGGGVDHSPGISDSCARQDLGPFGGAVFDMLFMRTLDCILEE